MRRSGGAGAPSCWRSPTLGGHRRSPSGRPLRALTLIRQAGLTEPQTEVMLFGFPADFYFAEARLVLEVDSFGWHGLVRSNFNRDRRRDRVHRQHGLEVMRVTYDELRAKPLVFIGDLSGAIARRLAARAAGSLA
jgi:very-short-patch-repair endonuclease